MVQICFLNDPHLSYTCENICLQNIYVLNFLGVNCKTVGHCWWSLTHFNTNYNYIIHLYLSMIWQWVGPFLVDLQLLRLAKAAVISSFVNPFVWRNFLFESSEWGVTVGDKRNASPAATRLSRTILKVVQWSYNQKCKRLGSNNKNLVFALILKNTTIFLAVERASNNKSQKTKKKK